MINPVAKVDQNILSRVKKALALASHEGTGEDEAKAALRVASKFMQVIHLPHVVCTYI